jgi:hypothetical protein
MLRSLTAAAALAATVALGATTTSAGADPTWAPAATATIHPGVQMVTAGAQCTANFVFSDGAAVYVGYAAHCAGTGAPTETNGCEAGSLPLGTAVEIDGASRPGTLAYSSWLAMQAAGETNPDACAHNDFALVRIHADDVAAVNPSVPVWGGPTGVNTSGVRLGERVYAYGNSGLRLGLALLSPKTGVSQGTDAGGWNHPILDGPAPDVPGDSGSGLLDSRGRATGDLSHLSVGVPTLVRNNYSDIGRALAYANSHGLGSVRLVHGTEPFDPDALPLGI